MRRHAQIFIFATVVLATTAFSGIPANAPAAVAPSPQRPQYLVGHLIPEGFWPSEMAFWTREDGIVMGTIYKSRHEPAIGVVARTNNGGHAWKITLASYGTYSFGGMPDGHTAWVNQFPPSNAGPTMNTVSLKSTDMARTWRPVHQAWNHSLFTYWVTDSFGWAEPGRFVGESHYIVYTRNAGRTWAKEDLATSQQFYMSSPPDFVSMNAGWELLAGQPSTGIQGKALFKTVNGGKSWQPVLEVPFDSPRSIGGLNALGYASGISFLPDGHGWLWETRGFGFYTTDGGKQWYRMKITQAEYTEANDGELLTDTSGYLLLHVELPTQSMELLYTNDTAKTWTVMQKWKNPFND